MPDLKQPEIVNIGFEEFLRENVKDLTDGMPWIKDKDLRLCTSIDELKTFVDKAIDKGHCALDLETTGLNTRVEQTPEGIKPTDKIVGFCLSYDTKLGIYAPINHKEGPQHNLPEKEVLNEIKRLCSVCITIYHNAKFDMAFLENYGIVVDQFDRFEDTMILSKLYDTGQKEIGLKLMSSKYLSQTMLEFEDVTKGSKRFDFISPEVGYVYAAGDAVCTLGLFEFYMGQDIIKQQRAIYNLEKRALFVVKEMESNLVLIDGPYLEEIRKKAEIRLKEIEKEIHKLAGKEFNLGSPQQLGKILFEELKFPPTKKTASGQYSTDNASLEKLADNYPIVKSIIEYRGLEKSLGTYINNLLLNRDKQSQIKLNFHQMGTETGRFSSPGGKGINEDGYSGVNIQSIPSNYSEDSPDVRKAFIARPGKKLVAMDYSGEELRVATNLSKEPKWVDEFLYGNADLHTATGKVVFGREEISPAERQTSKCVATGTLIASERGWIPIERLKEGDRVITHMGKLKRVNRVWDMGVKRGVEVITKSGHRLVCGVNHRFQSDNGNWIKAKDLKIKQMIKTSSCEKINPPKIQRIHFNIWDKGNNNFVSENLPYIELNPLWGKLIGYILGDGSANVNSVSIVCSDQYEDVKQDILDTVRELGLDPKIKKSRRKKKNGEYGRWLYKIQVGSRTLVRFFREIGFTGRREFKKIQNKKNRNKSTKIFRVPRIIFESPKNVAREFLRGLFETDGTVGKSEVSVTTKDLELAEDLVLLLSEFGMKAYIYEHFSKKYDRMYYKVGMGIENSRKFEKEIGFISESKNKRLYSCTHKEIKSTRGSYYSRWETEIKKLRKVKSVHLMDLTVEDDHTYIAQGLITHNTINFLVLYGGGPRGLSQQAKISEREAKRMLVQFFAGLPVLKKWIDVERAKARKLKYAKTSMGRVRPLHMYYNSGDRGLEAHADRCAVNHLVQGVCADIMKTTMVRIRSWIRSNDLQNEIKLLITMHDEIVFEMPEDKLGIYIPKLYNIMKLEDILQGILKWSVPLDIDAEYGDSWHVDRNFYKENPSASKNEKVEFHLPTQIVESSSAPIGQLPSSVQPIETPSQTEQSQDTVQTVPSQIETPATADSTTQPAIQKTVEEPSPAVSSPESDSSSVPKVSVIQEMGPSEELQEKTSLTNDKYFVYTIQDRRKSTVRRLNSIVTFLLDEARSKARYCGPTKVLKIRDQEGNSLLVSELPVRVDSFLALSRFFGV